MSQSGRKDLVFPYSPFPKTPWGGAIPFGEGAKGDEENPPEAAGLESLEVDRVLALVAEGALSPYGRRRIFGLPFFRDPERLKEELGRVGEMKDLLTYDDPLPLAPFEDFDPILDPCEVPGHAIRPEWAARLGRFLAMLRGAVRFFKARPEKYPGLNVLVFAIPPLEALEAAIDRVVDPEGRVRDTASPELHRIRREIEHHQTLARRRLEALLAEMAAKGYAQQDRPTLREGRLVIAMKQAYAARLKGIVVDHSDSGATVFIEPDAVIEIQNTLRRLVREENQEVERLLRGLTDRIRESLPDLRITFYTAGELDGLYARARYARAIDAHAPAIATDGTLELLEARHPLLLAKMPADRVVPLSLTMGPALKTLVLTGPNAGGKTVALKTVGLCAWMFQHGLFIPARPDSRFPLFGRIFVDIGDRQSIAQDLSTFSSHVHTLREILKAAGPDSLVLLDELGTSTDPEEGAALAMAVLRALTTRGATTLATTHIGALKVFAYETPGVENGSMCFDQETLTPTFRFQMGLPGSSYAFEIAERLGLDRGVVQEARSWLGGERGHLERLLVHLGETMESVRRTESALIEKEARLNALLEAYEARMARIHEEAEVRRRELLDEAERVLKEANVQAERLIREIRESQASKAVIQRTKAVLQEQKKRIMGMRSAASPQKEEIHRGSRVRWKQAGGVAEVLTEPDPMGRVEILLNAMRLKVPASELVAIEGHPSRRESPSPSLTTGFPPAVSLEIDLRGHKVDEALALLDRHLGEVAVAGLSQVRIIHGKGTGALRRAIGAFLEGHPLVKSFRLGRWDEGDTGVTVVELV